MDIKLVYTDPVRVEQGYLHNFSIDVDAAQDKDFEITVAQDNNILQVVLGGISMALSTAV